MAKTFRQLRNDWMDNNKSDAINYCMPVNIGVISQNIDNPDEKQINAAVEKIIKQLERWFGKFSARIRSGSHHQLIVMKRENDPLADTIARRSARKSFRSCTPAAASAASSGPSASLSTVTAPPDQRTTPARER